MISPRMTDSLKAFEPMTIFPRRPAESSRRPKAARRRSPAARTIAKSVASARARRSTASVAPQPLRRDPALDEREPAVEREREDGGRNGAREDHARVHH